MAAAGRFRTFLNARPRLERSLQLLAWTPVAVFVSQHVASIIAIEGRCVACRFLNSAVSHADMLTGTL